MILGAKHSMERMSAPIQIIEVKGSVKLFMKRGANFAEQ